MNIVYQVRDEYTRSGQGYIQWISSGMGIVDQVSYECSGSGQG